MNHHTDAISIEELICDETFKQYCEGSNVVSQIYWEEWIGRNSHRSADIEEARRLISILSARQGNRLEQLKQLRTGIQQSESFREILNRNISDSEQRPGILRLIAPYLRAAAAVILILSALFYFRMDAVEHSGGNKSALLPIEKVYEAGAQQRRTVILPDGSLVTLGRNSSLKLARNFNMQNREVWLNGEGYFDVVHHDSRKFLVHSLKNDIRVLGTTFNVKAYANTATNETTLLKGRVEVIPHDNPENSIILSPNQKLITTVITGENSLVSTERLASTSSSKESVKEIEELSWVRSRLDIEDEPLQTIAARLQNWYGIEIVIEDEEVKTYRYSGVFENESVIKTLEALQLSYPFTFDVEDEKIIISK